MNKTQTNPQVLLIGQYSVGKTSFIRFLLEKDFPGVRIGPEPTTDRFTAIMWGRDERTIQGNALAADAERPFTALSKFGISFLVFPFLRPFISSQAVHAFICPTTQIGGMGEGE